MIQQLITKLQRPVTGLTAALLVLASATPLLLLGGHASAGQVTERFIKLSKSTPAGTSVTYNVSFKPTSTNTIGGIVVDFCGDSPIIGSTTCTLPTNFTLGTSVSISNLTGFSTSTGSWVTTNSLQGGAAASNFQVAKYTNTTAQTPTGTSTAISFDITGVTNPSSTGTFYARIVTFDTSANAVSNYTASGTTRASSFAGERDEGGVALATATNISISATVQETLTFCVSKAAPGSGCSGTTTPTLTLGAGTPPVLGTATADDTAYTQITSNAVSGVIVRMNALTSNAAGATLASCAGLSRDGGATCPIAAQGAFAALSSGAGKFGLNVANGTGGSGTVTANGNYGTTAGSYGMGAAVITAYGDPIESSSGATTDVNSLLTFRAAAAATTPAGVYSAYESLVATGTF